MATDRATWLTLVGTVLLGALAAGGCYNANEVQAFLQQPRAPVSGVEYRVLPPDALAISSTRVPEIDGFRTVIRPDGKINLPLLGEIYVADKTPKQIEQDIIKAAMKYYEEADATVQVEGYNSRRLYVLGEVANPGPLPWTGTNSLLDVLAQAQVTERAWPERVLVIRGAFPQQGGYAAPASLKYNLLGVHDATGGTAADANAPAGGAAKAPAPASGPQKLTVNLLAMVEHGDMANNILLQPNDIVYVQTDPFVKLARQIDNVMAPVRSLTNGLDDARELQVHWKWMEHSFPPIGSTRTTLNVR